MMHNAKNRLSGHIDHGSALFSFPAMGWQQMRSKEVRTMKRLLLAGVLLAGCSGTLAAEQLSSVLARLAAEPQHDELSNEAIDRIEASEKALVLLGEMKCPEAIPTLRRYVANPKSQHPTLALRTMLLIENSAAMREYVGKTLETWMPRVGSMPPDPPQWSDVEQGFVRYIVLSPLPKADIVDIAMRSHLYKSDMRDATYYKMGLQAHDSRCITVLRACSKCGLDHRKLVIHEIEQAAKTHEEDLKRMMSLTKTPTGGKHVWSDDEWQAYRKQQITRIKAALANLEALKKELQ